MSHEYDLHLQASHVLRRAPPRESKVTYVGQAGQDLDHGPWQGGLGQSANQRYGSFIRARQIAVRGLSGYQKQEAATWGVVWSCLRRQDSTYLESLNWRNIIYFL